MSNNDLRFLTRRTFFKEIGFGIGGMALSQLLVEAVGAQPQSAPGKASPSKFPNFSPKAKSVIFLFMAGAPSQLDLFDPKPTLMKYNGEACPEELLKGERFAFIKGTPKLLGSPYQFKQVGASGQWVSELLPQFRDIVDDVTVIRSMQTTQFNHAPGQIYLNTGFQVPGRPSMGSWLTYGLGTENKDLPGFVVLISGENNPDGGKACWSSGFLPTMFQGVEFRSEGDPVLFVKNPDGVTSEIRRDTLDALRDLNMMKHVESLDPEIESRISQYELAYRMQSSVPELTDLSKETATTLAMYGAKSGERSFANNCLLARRLVERGVRFVQLYHRGWDNHGTSEGDDIKHKLPRLCQETDQAAAALIKDLKQRGLLESTIVVWAGEFGRTPMNEGRGGSPYLGRDHHPHAYTIWVAGGGFKPGLSYGSTDELGYSVAESPISVHDLHATMLHLLGVDHTLLTYKSLGRNFRLTDVEGTVVKSILS